MSAVVAINSVMLSGGTFVNKDFSGQDLKKRNMSHSKFINCSFDGADLYEANCEWSDFTGSTFRDAILTRTNFKDAKLMNTVFAPKDAYGCTLTMQCQTFKNMEMSQLQWYCLLMLCTLTVPQPGVVKGDIKGGLIAAIGAERYARLHDLFSRREM